MQWFKSLILPWIVLATSFAAIYARLLRGSLIDVMGEDYIRTARAKGVEERAVIMRHGVRSAITPVVTVLGLDIGILLGGAILTETVFNIQGIGRLAYDAIIAQRSGGRSGYGALRRLLHHLHEPHRGHRLRLPRPAGPVLMALLEVRNLEVSFLTDDGVVQVRRRHLLLRRGRALARHRRRVGLGQERLEPDAAGPHARGQRALQRRGDLRRPRPADHDARPSCARSAARTSR